MVSGVHRRLLPLLLLLAAALPAGCSPSPCVMLENYLEEKQSESLSTLETISGESASCPEMHTDWLDESRQPGGRGKGAIPFMCWQFTPWMEDEFTLLELPSAPAEYTTWQQDAPASASMGSLTASCFRSVYRAGVTRFSCCSRDGPAGALGAVEQSSQPGELDA